MANLEINCAHKKESNYVDCQETEEAYSPLVFFGPNTAENFDILLRTLSFCASAPRVDFN
jgi:hypothetical protein